METHEEAQSFPICYVLEQQCDVTDIILSLAGMPYLSVLDSARQMPGSGQYSFLAADPFGSLCYKGGALYWNDMPVDEDPWTFFKKQMAQWSLPTEPGQPPFRGGAMGYVGYEMNDLIPQWPPTSDEDWSVPEMWVHFYDVILVYDHAVRSCVLYSSGFPEMSENKRQQRAQERLDYFRERLEKNTAIPALNTPINQDAWVSNFSEQTYQEAVEMVRKYIVAGDIFQANISQRFTASLPPSFQTLSYYFQLRSVNPAPFSAFLSYDDIAIASASPERFVQVRSGQAETRPIKGTRPRDVDPTTDDRLANDLQNSAKDRAENIMIVDLLRNDFSKVCLPGTVTVPVLCGLESYVNVHHLVSVVRGQLKPGMGSLDIFHACFPGGSITGAPKKRAMEIIREIEGLPRHIYCGAIGYWGFDGDMDTNIAIRTVLFQGNKTSFQSGGGITWLSDPLQEYRESLVKADRLFKSFDL
jgi:para-aminobenzoate synthetase component 1